MTNVQKFAQIGLRGKKESSERLEQGMTGGKGQGEIRLLAGCL